MKKAIRASAGPLTSSPSNQKLPRSGKESPPDPAKTTPSGKKRETPEDPLRIVALGGGTGLATLLHGLKLLASDPVHHPPNRESALLDLAAVVTVSDDGGSSGRLRRDFDILAPGDIRNCMVALAEDEALLSRLFQYRFVNGRGLRGHSFGNLFLTALTDVTGDFHQAIQLSSEVLAIRGRIYPSTLTNVRLEAELEGGRSVRGESRITRTGGRIRKIRLKPRRCPPMPETLQAIAEADLITLGPGSLYTSVIPNLLVEGIPKAINESAAWKVYVSNLMSEPGETDGYTASDHLKALYRHAPDLRIDFALVNSSKISASSRRRYLAQNAHPVQGDESQLRKMGVEVVRGRFLAPGEIVRHNADQLARTLVDLARRARRSQSVNLSR